MNATAPNALLDDKKIFYNRFLLIVAGLGGLLYGIDVGIIAGALPYMQATFGRSSGHLLTAAKSPWSSPPFCWAA